MIGLCLIKYLLKSIIGQNRHKDTTFFSITQEKY